MSSEQMESKSKKMSSEEKEPKMPKTWKLSPYDEQLLFGKRKKYRYRELDFK